MEKCAEKDVTEEKLFALHPDAVAALYASDLFVAGSGYTDFAARVENVVGTVLLNKGSDDLGPGPYAINYLSSTVYSRLL